MGVDSEPSEEASKSQRERGNRRGVVFQVVTSIALSMTHFYFTASMAMSGVFSEQMLPASPSFTINSRNNVTEHTTGDIQLTGGQVSWINAAVNFGNIVGFVLSSYINPRLGTLRIVQITSPVTAGGFILMGLGRSFPVILSGRILAGIGVGTCIAPTVNHMGEVTSVKLRGVLTTLLIVVATNGVMFTFILGWLLGWRKTCLVIGTVPAIIQFVATLPLPRSARWLISKGYPQEEAERSLRFYLGAEHDTLTTINEIKKSLGEAHKHDASLFQVLATMRYRHHLLPFLIMIAMYAFYVFSGGLAATSFAPVIFKKAGGFSNPYLGSILVGALRFVASTVTAFIVGKAARRTLIMINGGVGSLACLVTAFYFFYKTELVAHGWIPVVSVLVIVCVTSTGIGPLTTVVGSEIFPNAIRAEIVSISLIMLAIFNFIMVYTFPLLMGTLGSGVVFSCFAGFHVLMFLFARFCLPETRGRTIEQVQKLFMKSVSDDDIQHL